MGSCCVTRGLPATLTSLDCSGTFYESIHNTLPVGWISQTPVLMPCPFFPFPFVPLLSFFFLPDLTALLVLTED
jgi:hypothetical protein